MNKNNNSQYQLYLTENQTQSNNNFMKPNKENIEGNNITNQPSPSSQFDVKKSDDHRNLNNELVNVDEKTPIKQFSYSVLSQSAQGDNQFLHRLSQISKKNNNSKMDFQFDEQNKQHDQNQLLPQLQSLKSNQKQSTISQKGKISNENLKDMNVPILIATLEQGIRTSFQKKSQICQFKITLSIIAKIIKSVRHFKSYLIPKRINRKQAEIINDISHYDLPNTKLKLQKEKDNSLKTAYKKLMEISQKNNTQITVVFKIIKHELKQFRDRVLFAIDRNIPIIDALNPWKVIYDILKIIITITAIFLNTVEVFFDISFDDMYPSIHPKLRYVFMGFYSFTIFLSLNTAISHKGLVVSNRKDIFKYYFKKRFIPDSISIISFIQFHDIKKIYLEIIKLFILSQIQVVSQKLQSFQYFTHSFKKNRQMFYIVRLIKLLLTIILVAHFVAIVFYGQTLIFSEKHSPTWVNQTVLLSDNDIWSKKYIFALYFSVTTMMTVGYGDISPKNQYEAIFCIIAMVIACGVFAYSFNLIGIIIQDMNKKQRQFKKKINKVNLYLSDRNIDDELRFKVQRFLEYKQINLISHQNSLNLIIFQILHKSKRYKHDKSLSKEDEQEILQELSPHLLEKIVYQTKQKVLCKDMKVFSIFSQEFNDKICQKLKEIHLNKDEIIFEQDSKQDDPQMYFIHKGTVEIYFKNKYDQDGTILKILNKGQQFGENSFLLNTPRSASARAIEPTILYSISKSDLIDQLSYYAQEKEKYYLIINKMVFRQSNQIIGQQCYFCNSEKHGNLQLINHIYQLSIFYLSDSIKNLHNYYILISIIDINSRSIRYIIIQTNYQNSIVITQCPKLHFSPERDLHILKSNYSEPHFDRELFRRKRRKESGYSVLIIKNKYSLAAPIGIQKENELSDVSGCSDDEQPQNSEKNILKRQQTFKTFPNLINQQDSIQNISNIIQEPQYIANFKNFVSQDNYTSVQAINQALTVEPEQQFQTLQQKLRQQFNSKQTESLSFIPQEDEVIQTNKDKLPSQKNQQIKQGDEKLENQNSQINSALLKSKAQKKPDQQIHKQISKYNHANQYKMFSNIKQQNQENHLQTHQKVKQQQEFFIPKMSFNEELDGSDQGFNNIDEIKTPVNYPSSQFPNSRRYSIQKKMVPLHMNQRNSYKEFHHSETIQNFIQFKEDYNSKSHARLGQSIQMSTKIARKPILKSNTVKMSKETLNLKKIDSKNNFQEQKQKEQEMDISDQMKQYKYFYPMFNYQNVIQHYNMLKSIQKVKFPKYFNVYSIYNRKNAVLRNQAKQFEQQPKIKSIVNS